MISGLPAHIDPQHCILTRQYAVYTPAMEEMINQIGDWIEQQTPGGYIYGPSRFGKTRAVLWYLEGVLTERFGSSIPLVIWNHERTNTPTDGWFWHQLLLATKFEFVDPAKPPKKTEGRDLCVQRLMALARMRNSNHIILLIDEAHDMVLHEWKWLVGLQNRLDWEGFMLTVFSIGSHQLGYQHDYMASTGNAHVAARFMAAHAKYRGIRGVPDLHYVLNGYDVDSEWPASSGESFLRYFAPAHFDDGLRLANHASALWEAMMDLRPDNARKFFEFPMQHVARSSESVLRRLAGGNSWKELTSKEGWRNELEKVNFSGHMRIIATAG